MKIKKIYFLFVLILAGFFSQSNAQYIGRQKIDQFPINSNGSLTYGLTWLPTDYVNTTTSYPLIIFLHGAGEDGDGISGLNQLIGTALPKKIADGWNAVAVNPLDNKNYKFIVVSPQAPEASNWSYQYMHVKYIIADVMKRYRVDSSRIYITGLSAGGFGTWTCVTSDSNFTKRVSAIYPVAAVNINAPESNNIQAVSGKYGVKVWSVCGMNDAHYSTSVKYTEIINSANPTPKIPAKLTGLSNLDHVATVWNTAYDPNWRSNNEKMNAYEWMLQYTKGGNSNDYLGATADSDKTISLPTNSVSLTGKGLISGSGQITKYTWSKVSGPTTYKIASPLSASTAITDLTAGTYIFRFTVVDNLNNSASADVKVTVNINASNDGNVSLPVSPVCKGQKRYLTKGSDNGNIIRHGSFIYNPGDTIVLRSSMSPWSYVYMNGISGTPTCPVYIMNEGGQVLMSNGFSMGNCQYIKILGKGDRNHEYGIYIKGNSVSPSGVAVNIAKKSKNIEVSNIFIRSTKYGFWVKNEADCDVTLNYPNWTIDSIEIHDDKIRHTESQGFYLGTTDPNNTSRPISCNGEIKYYTPSRLANIKIYNNDIDSTGRPGIQLSVAMTGHNEIFNNIINHSGLQFDDAQGAGIALGGYTKAYVHNNIIKNTYTYGIASFGGTGQLRIEDNNVDSSGWVAGRSPGTWPTGILIDTRLTIPVDSTQFIIKNNVFGKVANLHSHEIYIGKTYNTYKKDNIICNNRVGTTDATVYVESGISWNKECLPQTTPPVNTAPTVNAGSDKSITLPVNEVSLSGSASDVDGSIASYQWTKIAGPSQFTISTPSGAATKVSNLVQGLYSFELKVTDDKGAIAKDVVNVTVYAPVNTAPTVNAGSDKSITLPVNEVSLSGSASDVDGSIASYQWTKIAGPSQFTISTPSGAATKVSNLVQGLYSFELKVTDDKGAIAKDVVNVTVYAPVNTAPTVNAGSDKSITLPVNEVSLSGSASDVDGSIASYQWTKIAGPSQFTISTPSGAATKVSNLVQGLYSFELKVTDDKGAIAKDVVNVTVYAPVNTAPTASLSIFAYPNPTTDITEISLKTTSSLPIDLRFYDSYGKQIGWVNNVDIKTTLKFSTNQLNLPKGTYYVTAIQGFTKVTLKVVKL